MLNLDSSQGEAARKEALELATERISLYFSAQQAANIREQNKIEPHQGEVNLNYSFEDVFCNIERRGEVPSRTSVGVNFTAKATITMSGIHNGEATIRFFHGGRENARAYRYCWGHYYNCNGTRIGMYCQALDVAISASVE